MPTQAVIGTVNTACAPLNIKVNVAEWTPAQNLTLSFTHDSINSQIKKAGATILGVVARSLTKTTFLKCEKWSRIVVHKVPTQHWCTETRSIVDFTREALETETCNAHPLLTEAIFMEGPDLTTRNGPELGSTHANISFAIPDPEEA